MSLNDVLGWIASILVFSAFWMRGMIALRIVAMASNVVFLVWAVRLHFVPVIMLHGALLPANFWRMQQKLKEMHPDEPARTGGLWHGLPSLSRR